MEKYNLPHDLNVFGIQVRAFPDGIEEAFQALVKMLPAGEERSFYGVCDCKDGSLRYYAAAEETFNREAEKYDCETYLIEKGEYLTVTINNWREKTASINNVFASIIEDSRVDKTKPAVEWYKNNVEMLCMVKLKQAKA